MSTTDALADPMTSTVASALTVPLRQLYALLWRAGVVEIVATERMSRRAPERVAPCPVCQHVPTAAAGRRGYSRAVG
ncbi:MAG TPA: Rv1535 domain-containing protein [Mycobacterium sp.]|nr:Rv1535 domain-containing protein [Mycobacterium sp.]